jgi:hypothetical protein
MKVITTITATETGIYKEVIHWQKTQVKTLKKN